MHVLIVHACTMIIVHASIRSILYTCACIYYDPRSCMYNDQGTCMYYDHSTCKYYDHSTCICLSLSVCVCLCLCIYLSLSGRLEPRLPEHSSARHCVHPSERSSDDPFNIWSSLAISITSLAAMPNVCRGGSRLRFGMWRRLMRTHW